jgi:gamma-resorcylate decarboxylase
MVNDLTSTADPERGLYLDDLQFDPLWKVAERLQKPVFIHPRVPLPCNLRILEDIPTLHGMLYCFA